ncbi:hypothetical protein, partial [Xanthomonas arboricola]|uniref:hypothetical protein n=1 Tax=Xanthomonas arboricola TaxID=56448 RepID=UPI0011B3696F
AAKGPATGKGAAPERLVGGRLKAACRVACIGRYASASVANNAHHALLLPLFTVHTEHLDRSLPAHRRGTLRGMDAA